MATEAQIAANRRNAGRSRGPKTRAGKNRSRANALKHGLTAIIIADRPLEETVSGYEQLFLGLAGGGEAAKLYARAVAESQYVIDQARALRHLLINDAYAAPSTFSRPMHWLDRVRFNWGRMSFEEVQKRAFGGWENENYQIVDRPFDEAQALAICLKKRATELKRLQRYEERALNKRREALRALLNF
jgi:hypothetical protein